jgi:LacI family transcriptional regulator
MSEGKLTLTTVAREAGVSTYVASLSLRGRKGVAAATRKRVEEVADRLGYRLNGAAAFLAKQRTVKGGKALLVGYVVSGTWSQEKFLKSCSERGWRGLCLPLAEWRTPAQATRLAWNRGIDGLLVGAGPFDAREQADLARFGWDKFAAVKLSRALPELPLHLVRLSAFDYMVTVLEAVWGRGYRRLAVVLHTSGSARDNMARLGAVLAFRERHADDTDFSCVWCRMDAREAGAPITDEVCLGWVRGSGAEVVVVDLWTIGRELLEAGLRVPGEVGLASVLTEKVSAVGEHQISGCDIRMLDQYRIALEILEGEILAGRRGFPARPTEHVMEPEWIEGNTLPLRGEAQRPRTIHGVRTMANEGEMGRAAALTEKASR